MDDRMKRWKKEYNNIAIPSELDHVVEKALRTSPAQRPRARWLAATAAAFFIFAAGLNISPAFAKALTDVPFIGKVVEVLTFKEYHIEEGGYQADIKVPEINNLADPSLAETLNQQYVKEGQALYEAFMAEMERAEAFGEDGLLKVDSGYEVKTETEQILSLGRYVEETVGSSMTTIQYDTIDKKNQVIVTLPSLFKDNSYIDTISENIKSQMTQQMNEDSSISYFVESADDPTGTEGFSTIAAEQSFYINEENKLVISFNEYEVAPGYMGVVEFVIPTDVLQDCLVSNEYVK
ncbi:DUF3298 and DUF4163 domain-containing protein [Halalkalibacter oceani]|uniref:DUF3298 and DUF4163 domain-containing protein n=1 Tax=Halalkalibacter oceani TaxID=1653776 RepID=UPI00339AE619